MSVSEPLGPAGRSVARYLGALCSEASYQSKMEKKTAENLLDMIVKIPRIGISSEVG